jgi:Ca2+-binding EF-hand superfamily protein
MIRRFICLLLAAAAAPAFAQTAPAPAAMPQGQGPDAVFAAWDTNKDGALSQAEFRAGFVQTRDAVAMQRLRGEFQRHDADKSGRLEAVEYSKLVLVQRAGKSAPLLSAFDKDKNQGLDFNEYLDVVKTLAKAPAPAPAAKK